MLSIFLNSSISALQLLPSVEAVPVSGCTAKRMKPLAWPVLNAVPLSPIIDTPTLTLMALALFVHTTGILAKLFSEVVEAIDPRPVEGVRATGGSHMAEICFGIIPQVLPLWVSYALYRFESNVRSATVIGIVGAGGIGMALHDLMASFYYQQACAVLLIIVITVV